MLVWHLYYTAARLELVFDHGGIWTIVFFTPCSMLTFCAFVFPGYIEDLLETALMAFHETLQMVMTGFGCIEEYWDNDCLVRQVLCFYANITVHQILAFRAWGK